MITIRNRMMRKTSVAVIGVFALLSPLSSLLFSSCSDMLDVDNPRAIDADRAINKKTDSLFYAWGIAQAMQEAADMYVVQNEVRGDLVSPYGENASAYLKELAEFRATIANKYDSAYVYYAVVNNCNNFLKHRDQTLKDNSTNVTIEEVAAVYTYRAWAYLQLCRAYGFVKYTEEPLTSYSEIEDASRSLPQLNMQQLVAQLTPDLERLALQKVQVPEYGTIPCGTTNAGQSKTIQSSRIYIPLEVMLGELYLEAAQDSTDYFKAAKWYYTYLYDNKILVDNEVAGFHSDENTILPTNFSSNIAGGRSSWANGLSSDAVSVGRNDHSRIITYIPMAVNRLMGKTSELPELFGYDYFSTQSLGSGNRYRYMRYQLPQLVPSEQYKMQADSALYYYSYTIDGNPVYTSAKLGDQRRWARLYNPGTSDDATVAQLWFPTNYESANVVLFRNSTVWLHLAEALNRAGYPDIAFAVLKEGISPDFLNNTTYATDRSKALLTDSTRAVPMLTATGQQVFYHSTDGLYRNYGFHGRGCSDAGGTLGTFSEYQFEPVVAAKVAELSAKGIGVVDATTAADSLFAKVNAVEDLLCDEYAMEFAFDGTRYADLMRLARHKNNDSFGRLYGAGFGGRWLRMKLDGRNVAVDLSNEANWYLPY